MQRRKVLNKNKGIEFDPLVAFEEVYEFMK